MASRACPPGGNIVCTNAVMHQHGCRFLKEADSQDAINIPAYQRSKAAIIVVLMSCKLNFTTSYCRVIKNYFVAVIGSELNWFLLSAMETTA